jgi:hypothetical protein
MTRNPDDSNGASSAKDSSIGAKTSWAQAPTAFSSTPLHSCQIRFEKCNQLFRTKIPIKNRKEIKNKFHFPLKSRGKPTCNKYISRANATSSGENAWPSSRTTSKNYQSRKSNIITWYINCYDVTKRKPKANKYTQNTYLLMLHGMRKR